ncbi:MAG: c-type cytochrome [Alphaproteobacteria bacterium]|nr:c-type cytochrome [Alphaproteobacteria bacterium]MBU2379352.1 c-type cytochrome [Alphaproteobacteria bacterium]
MGLGGCDAAKGDTDRALTETGQLVALSGGGAGAQFACFTCHGLEGQGDGVTTPRLAGLDAGYLQKQMEDYAAGTRPDDVMGRIAGRLDASDRRAVAAFYSRMPAPEAAAAPVPAPTLYLTGDPRRGITACSACHGAVGQGAGPGNPAISGQPRAYVADQLERWRHGDRRNDPRGVMAVATARLTDEEIQTLAAWLETAPPAPAPASASASAFVSAGAAARPAASREARRPDRSDGA